MIIQLIDPLSIVDFIFIIQDLFSSLGISSSIILILHFYVQVLVHNPISTIPVAFLFNFRFQIYSSKQMQVAIITFV